MFSAIINNYLLYLFCVWSGSGDDHEADKEADGDGDKLQVPNRVAKPATKYPQSPTKTFGKKKGRVVSTSGTQKSSRVYQTGLRVLYTAGRPPWYNTHGQLKEAFVIGKSLLIYSSLILV